MNIITPSQALLLLIQHYKEKNNEAVLIEFKKRYLSGVKLEEGECPVAFCNELATHPVLKKYRIVSDAQSINDDPTRRYFETRLAYETLAHHITQVNMQDITDLFCMITDCIDFKVHADSEPIICAVMGGRYETAPSDNQPLNEEINALLFRLSEKSIFKTFSPASQAKLEWLIRVFYMSMVNSWLKTDMPFDIYFKSPMLIQKGRIFRQGSESTRNQHFGLLKGYMPLAMDDPARSSKVFEYRKTSDLFTFNLTHSFPKDCFRRLAHLFSSGLSGTALMLLRVLAKLHADKQSTVFVQSLENVRRYFQLMFSIFLYSPGGHSLHEYMCVLSLPQVQNAFISIPGFSSLDLEDVFYTHNQAAFEAALDATIDYQTTLFKRQSLHAALSLFAKKERSKQDHRQGKPLNEVSLHSSGFS